VILILNLDHWMLLLEQNVFNIATLSFDDNKVLKCQLVLLIFVQVCRTIVKNYNQVLVLKEQKRAKESTKEAYVSRESLKTRSV